MTERQGLEAYADIRFLTPEECVFKVSVGGLLSLQIGDDVYEGISIQRAFPFSHGDAYLSVRDKDAKEIGMIRSLSQFGGEAERLIANELERRYFVPTITRISRIKEEFGYAYWDVDTDRGPRRFTVRGLQESVLPIGEQRILIIDVDGNRFEIPEVAALDAKSFKLIDALL